MKTVVDIFERRKFHHLVLTCSVFFLLLTAVKSNLGAPQASVYWYASELYWTFWPGLGLAFFGIILSIKNKRRYLGPISVLVPVFFLYGLPYLVHDMLPVFDVYHAIPSRISLIETGTWNMETIPFPGSHIYQGFSIHLLNLSGLTYARIFPLILVSSIVIFIFSMARKISKKWAPVTPLIFLALNWYMEYHLAKQGFGVMIWAAFWLALFLYVDKKNYRIGVLAGVLLLSLIPSHPGMLIIVSFNFLALLLVTLISVRNKEERNYFYPIIPLLFIFGLATALFYTSVHPVSEYMDTIYEGFWEGLKNGEGLSLGGPTATSPQYGFVNNLRMLAGGLHSLLGLLGFLALYKKSTKKGLLVGAWFFSIYIWLLYPLTHEGFLIERAFLVSIIPASILTAAFLEHFTSKNFKFLRYLKSISDINFERLMRVTIILVIAAFLIAVPLTKNSIDTIETPSRSSYAAGFFAQENFEDHIYITDTHEGMFRYIESTESEDPSPTHQFRAKGKSPQDQPYGYPIPRTDKYRTPILFTDYFHNYIEIRYGNMTAVDELKQYEIEISKDSARIYDSGGSRLYVHS